MLQVEYGPDCTCHVGNQKWKFSTVRTATTKIPPIQSRLLQCAQPNGRSNVQQSRLTWWQKNLTWYYIIQCMAI